jgi:hypothetical protein
MIRRGEGYGGPEGHQVLPLITYRQQIREQFGVVVRVVGARTLDEIEATFAAHRADIALVMVSWAEPAEQVVSLFRRLSDHRRDIRIVFVDSYDEVTSPHFGVLPFVDRYVKRHVLKNRCDYFRTFDGGTPFTHHLSRNCGFDLANWHFGSIPSRDLIDKIVCGWNLGVAPMYRRLLRVTRPWAGLWSARPYAVNRRFGPVATSDSSQWYARYRAACSHQMEALARRHSTTGTSRVRRRRYIAEMCLSRIVFSPFGWGEVCFRDFEAIACGALLVKPSMSHIETRPDIFRPGESFVEVAWDLHNLVDTCEHYLSHGDEARPIVRGGQGILRTYFDERGFLEDFRRVIDGLI